MKRLFVIGMFFCFGCANAPVRQAAIDVNNLLQSRIRVKVTSFSKNSKVEVFLKQGNPVFGIFENYQVYDDTIWIQPDGVRGLFSDVSYNLNELQDIVVIKK